MRRRREWPILKSPGEIEAMKEAGRVSALALRQVGRAARPGVSTWELDLLAEEVIRSEGGVPAFKGYGGFPGSICASVNEQIVHGIPSRAVKLAEGDVLSVDTGAIVDGWVGDNAWTFPIGVIDEEKQRLLDVTERCMWEGIAAARSGNRLGDIGHAVQSLAEANGLGVVREYVGHGVGRAMHEPPNVPNYGRRGTGIELCVGMVLAIEPMINLGTHKTRPMPDGWLVCTRDGRPSAHFEKTIAITEDGPVLLTVEPGREKPL
ncbi:type I methionyl aminopeptidase [Parvibacter caecicola]|uniref:Methionine aminopeptidase n=1 Tax=Parvibacter caecicola TaxID=747645 RepID=A0A4T9TAT1_9ACTN|nr:type I methionyl aminopeptidase [Parvibacter caecicola]TJW12502.1 type I methionyl aminopeptidase [Parvibacter caecicola]